MANGGGSATNSSHLDLDCGGRLSVPMRPECGIEHSHPNSPGYHRRRKLSTASKVSYILILTYSYITFLIWDLYFRVWYSNFADLSCESVKYSTIFHRFEVNQRNIVLYFFDLKKGEKYSIIFLCQITKI